MGFVMEEHYDVAVIGAGHAGIEAALAAARLGMRTLCFAINLDSVGNMPCNPNIGGTAKGHLVREIDALGGEMAKVADRTTIQSRMLNLGKGPAVHSLRAQTDRARYKLIMKQTLEEQPNLFLKQAEIIEIQTTDGAVSGVVTQTGTVYRVSAAIVCSGTYLAGRIIIGDYSCEGGPDGMFAARGLEKNLAELGLPMLRFKTGTPARIHKKGCDFTKMEVQKGDENPVTFAFESDIEPLNTAVCYLTYTNETTHQIIRDNLHRSPLFSGDIKGVGPRYCPSIEDKVVRFSDKPRHQLFVEPMGLDTNEMYLQGMSSSLPEEVQMAMMRSVKGLEKLEVMRPAYAIEYDCVDPQALLPTLETKQVSGLYGAGQFNGTSGYEEAAAQGLVAGINAALKIKGEEPLILHRADAYIGTLIDDLVTRGTREPYRMMTSRSEYRLLLRQDNADRRLCHLGHRVGLVSDERMKRLEEKYAKIEEETKRLASVHVGPQPKTQELLVKYGSALLKSGIKLTELLRRPELNYEKLAPLDPERPELPQAVVEQVEILLKYEGYIKRQQKEVEQFWKMEEKTLPENIDYQSIGSLRIEARQKLEKVRPKNFGQANRISGVNPADITALMIYVSLHEKN